MAIPGLHIYECRVLRLWVLRDAFIKAGDRDMSLIRLSEFLQKTPLDRSFVVLHLENGKDNG